MAAVLLKDQEAGGDTSSSDGDSESEDSVESTSDVEAEKSKLSHGAGSEHSSHAGAWSGARCAFCWVGFLGFAALEVGIHVVYGVDKDVFEEEESAPGWSDYLFVAEGICRVCLLIGFVSMLMGGIETALRPQSSGSKLNIWDALSGGGRVACCTRAVAAVFSLFTVCVGVWAVLSDEEALPLWAAIYCHVADIFCHAVVTSALTGTLFDCCVAAKERRLGRVFADLCLCNDTLEQHSVIGPDKGAAGGGEGLDVEGGGSLKSEEEALAQSHRQATACARLFARAGEQLRRCLAWALVSLFVWAYVLAQHDQVPHPVHVGLSLIGIFCWAGLAWWVVDGVTSLPLLLRKLGPC